MQLVTEFFTDTGKKFFLVESKLVALNAIQAERASIQNRKWARV